ncbi:SRPBCC family protein [Actinomadura vinacea]|uniref:SRPBCC family protein n=1 Tax=Actinomadura vinacea TaxID=115336 RepID=A0ABP5X6K1_9ACTN
MTVPEAWRVLLDIERIAPCVPGATLTARDGDRYTGKIKVKLGPIGLTYSGTVTFVSQDEDARIAVLEAAGRETRGNGTAKAVVTCRLVEAGEATDVLVETDLAITGKPAQFGRGALAEVAGTLIGRFAANLAEVISAGSPGGGTEPHRADTSDAPAAGSEPIDLLDTAGGGIIKRIGPAAAVTALLLLLLVLRRLGRRGQESSAAGEKS